METPDTTRRPRAQRRRPRCTTWRRAGLPGARSSRSYAAKRWAARARAFAASTSRSLRRGARDQLVEQARGDLCDGVHRSLKRLGVDLRGLREAADLAHVLLCRRADLLVGRVRLEVVEGADVSTHAPIVHRPSRRHLVHATSPTLKAIAGSTVSRYLRVASTVDRLRRNKRLVAYTRCGHVRRAGPAASRPRDCPG